MLRKDMKMTQEIDTNKQAMVPMNVLLLGIFTCSIYFMVWYYKRGEEINALLGRQAVNPIFVIFPILNLYYYYTIDLALIEIGKLKGLDYQSSFIKWFLLGMVCGIGWFMALFQICDFINKVRAKSVT